MEPSATAVFLSLEPRLESRWETHYSGAKFLIAPLSAEQDNAFSRESRTMMGDLDPMTFAQKVAAACLKEWKGVGDKDKQPLACTEENVKKFIKWHGLTIGQWVIGQARSIAHFVDQEVGEAKKG